MKNNKQLIALLLIASSVASISAYKKIIYDNQTEESGQHPVETAVEGTVGVAGNLFDGAAMPFRRFTGDDRSLAEIKADRRNKKQDREDKKEERKERRENNQRYRR